MRRILTLALAVGLATLVAVGVVDTLRGQGDPRRAETPPAADEPASSTNAVEVEGSLETPPWVEDRAGLANRLSLNAIQGTLYLSPDRCLGGDVRPLRALRLPELELTEGPETNTCLFTVSADGSYAAGHEAAWSPSVPVFAAESRPDLFQVVDVKHSGVLGLPGSVPAFRPDGALTHALSGRVVEWSNDCAEAHEFISPPVSFGPEEVGPSCSRTAVSRHELARALPSGNRLESVDGLVWLDSSRLMAVLRAAGESWLAPYEEGRSLGYAIGLISRSTTAPLADPTGEYVALTPGGYLEIYDRDALRVWASSVEAVTFDWSPDGGWLAYAADDRNVYFVRTSDWTTRFSLRAATQGIAWR